MIRHILTASTEDLQTEAERISLLDEPDREEAILELLQELQFKQELLVWYESEEGAEDSMDFEEIGYDYEEEDYQDDNTMDLEDEIVKFNSEFYEDSWDPSTAEREADDENSQDSFSW